MHQLMLCYNVKFKKLFNYYFRKEKMNKITNMPLTTPAEQKHFDEYIGRRIRERRQKLNYTLSSVAENMGLSHQQIQKYEQGQSRLNIVTLCQFCTILGVDITYFTEGYHESWSLKDRDPQHSNVIVAHNKSALNVLVVENDAGDEQLIRRAVAECSVLVNLLVLHDGQLALDFLRGNKTDIDFPKPDIVLIEFNIPKLDGKSLLKEIKRDATLNDVPVIVLTNCIYYSEMKAAYKMHASGFICKDSSYDFFARDIDICMCYWGLSVVLPYRRFSNCDGCVLSKELLSAPDVT